jgi:rhodanese-related sulfurtransferase
MDELDNNIPYIVYCGTGRRSSAAAFLLVQKGYQASVLNGGVQVMAQDLKRSNNEH